MARARFARPETGRSACGTWRVECAELGTILSSYHFGHTATDGRDPVAALDEDYALQATAGDAVRNIQAYALAGARKGDRE